MATKAPPVPAALPAGVSFLDSGMPLLTQGLPSSSDSSGFEGISSGGILPAGPPFAAAAPPAGAGSAETDGVNIYNLPLNGNSLSLNPPLTAPAPNPPPIAREQVYQTYAGSDMRVMLTLSDPTGQGRDLIKQLVELTTLTVSIHRVKSPARACGYINPRGFARHGRTIAGTIILTQFTLDVLTRFLYSQLSTDLSKDSFYVKTDQLPPFDLTLVFCDEYGNSSYRRLLGVDIVDDGTIYSQNDMFTEQTLSYMAADFTPLLPLANRALLTPDPNSVAAAAQKTPMMVMLKPSVNDLTLVDPESPATEAVTSTFIPIMGSDAGEDPDSYDMPYSGGGN